MDDVGLFYSDIRSTLDLTLDLAGSVCHRGRTFPVTPARGRRGAPFLGAPPAKK